MAVKPKVLSLFSGVGGFDLGLERAGMETVFQCEWDKHATEILERHWRYVPRWGDISTLTGEYVLQHAPVIDVVAWGSPCQDLSVAGRRAGLDGARSGLFFEGIRIIKEIKEITNGRYPRVSIWENVAGALSSGAGSDFGQVLYEMDEAGACFSEWRVLDAQYFGIPQRRRRVFVITVFDSATAARCTDPLLPVSESVRRDIETSEETQQDTADETAAGFGSGGQWAAGDNGHGVLRQSISAKWSKGSSGPSGDEFVNMVVGSLAARDYKGVGNQYVNEGKVVVEPVVFDDDRRTGPHIFNDTVATLQAFMGSGGNNTPMVAQPIDDAQKSVAVVDFTHGSEARINTQTSPTLSARMGTGGNQTPCVIGFSHTQCLDAQPSEKAFPRLRVDGGGQAVAFDGFNQTVSDVAQTIRADKSDGDHVGMVLQPQVTAVHQATLVVRRLTPLECERLMGWPDDWTAIKSNGTPQTDGHRYKQCGNGVAAPVAQYIGEILTPILIAGDLLDSPSGEPQ